MNTHTHTPFAALEKRAFGQWIQGKVDGAWNGVRDNVVNPIKDTASAVGDGFGQSWDGAKQSIKGLGNAAAGLGKGVYQSATAIPQVVGGAIGGAIGGYEQGGTLGSTLGGAAQGTVDTVKDVRGAISGADQQFMGGAGDVVSGAAKNWAGAGKTLGNTAKLVGQIATAQPRAAYHGAVGAANAGPAAPYSPATAHKGPGAGAAPTPAGPPAPNAFAAAGMPKADAPGSMLSAGGGGAAGGIAAAGMPQTQQPGAALKPTPIPAVGPPAPGSPSIAGGPGAAAPQTPFTQESIAAPPKAIPVSEPTIPAGPTAEQLAQFQKGTASKFDPNSWVDRNKMQALMTGGSNWADNSAARAAGNQQYAWQGGGVKSAFATLGKSSSGGQAFRMAAALAAQAGKAGGKAVAKNVAKSKVKAPIASRRAAQSAAEKAKVGIIEPGHFDSNLRLPNMPAPRPRPMLGPELPGSNRAFMGDMASMPAMPGRLSRDGMSLAWNRLSPAAQKAIRYGGLGTGVAGVGAGGYMIGHGRGDRQGYASGLSDGIDAGVHTAMAGAEGAGGGSFLDRLAHLFNGQSALPQYGPIGQQIMNDKEGLIRALMAQRNA